MKSFLTGKKIAAMGLAVILTLAFAAPAFATDIERRTKNETPVELKYRGLFKENPVFEVVFGNKEEREYIITIRDGNNVVLHREKLKEAQSSKYFALNAEEIGSSTIEFVIYCRQTNKTVVYKVDRGTKVVENIAISKVR
jgi:hypothetical protein